MEVAIAASPNLSVAQSTAALEFLGPEMASLEEMLAALSTGEASARDSPGLASPAPSSSSPSSFPFPSPPPSSSPSSLLLLSSPPPPPQPSSLITPSTIDIQNSAVHKMAACGDLAALRMLILEHDADVNLPLKDGTTPVHCAVEHDREPCLQLLLDKGGNASALRDDRVTPVHIAAALGHARCLKLLLERGATANTFSQAGVTPLHLAVDWAHLACCQLLLLHGANVTLPRPDGLTAVHHAVWRDQPEVLRCLLDRLPARDCPPPCLMPRHTPESSLLHLAAQLPSEACLRVLLERLTLDVKAEDSLGRSVLSVASPACRTLLTTVGDQGGASLTLTVELKTQLEGATVSCTRVGSTDLDPSCSWPQLEEQLRGVLSLFFSQLDRGLRSRRLLRAEAEAGRRHDGNDDFSLGISMSRVSIFEMGFYRWTPGMQTEKLPYSIASNYTENKVAIIIDDTDNFCELIAFDILHPVSVLEEYLRLLDQYKNVVFHGPVNSGKSYLVQRLAQCWAAKEKARGEKPAVYQLKLSSKTSHDDLITFLKQKGVLVPVEETSSVSPLLIVDNLEKVSMTDLFGPLLDPLAQRGRQHAFSLTEHVNGNGQKFYFPEHFCILATLNRSRSTGIELHIQQRFRWVHFRHDAEPLRNLLARHFLRRLCHLGNGRLPAPDDALLRCTEWIICVWQRLNDSLGKLGLPDVVFGPCSFFKCPLERKSPQLILQWVQDLWNQTIAPQVREAVKKSTGAGGETVSGGQHKVANTALYVLMQRAVVLSCPLTLKEKEAYLQGFSGSNQLDLPFKSEKGRQVKTALRSETEKEGSDSSSPVSGVGTSRLGVAGRVQNRHPSGSSTTRTPNRHREERGRSLELFTGSNIKRRSLSESSMNKAARHLDQLEQQQEEEERQRQQQQHHHQQHQQQQHHLSAGLGPAASSLTHHAKVPKLEVRSSRILSLSNSFRTSVSPGGAVAAEAAKSGRVSPLHLSGRLYHHHHHHHQHKKSRSSENISPSGLYSSPGKALSSPNPFSFSLSTPKSSLVSFKFFDKSSVSSLEQSPLLSSPSSVAPRVSDSASSSSSSGGVFDADLSSAQMQATAMMGGTAALDVHSYGGQEAAGSV